MTQEKPQQIADYEITTFRARMQWKENTHLVKHLPTQELAVIDPGYDPGPLVDAITAAGGKLTQILVTHGHYDHTYAVGAVAQAFNVPCRVFHIEEHALRKAPEFALQIAGMLMDSPQPYEVFDEMSSLTFAGSPITIIPTPGHTRGSVCYNFPGFTFTGDTLLYEMVGATRIPGGNTETLTRSINTLLAGLAPEIMMFPGHGKPWPVEKARRWWTGEIVPWP